MNSPYPTQFGRIIFFARVTTSTFNRSMDIIELHRPQFATSGIPEIYWTSIIEKIKEQLFDAGESFELLLVDQDDEEYNGPPWVLRTTREIKQSDPSNVFLIDHAWTFRLDTAREHLQTIPRLCNRMCSVMGINTEDEMERVEMVLEKMWAFVNSYSMNAEGMPVENRLPIWYVHDEVGSSIMHSDEPNFRIVPFMYLPEQITYSLLFPLVDEVAEGACVSVNFVPAVEEGVQRDALLLPWRPCNLKWVDFTQPEPLEAYFLEGHIRETLPICSTEPHIDLNRPMKVYSQYELVRNYLTAPEFEIVDSQEEGDILWLTDHFKKYAELSEKFPHQFVNQFPFENVLTIKDLLAIICRRGSSGYAADLQFEPQWFPITFNLKTEVHKFASYFQRREDQKLDNHWIVKPFNLARSLDMHITSNLAQIVRLANSGCPKIVQKYIHKPVLFHRPGKGEVKFDVRYVICVKRFENALHGLDAYVYKNFFLRFANCPFELKEFENYEKHFTVMNYTEGATLHHLKCEDFKKEWQSQFVEKWDDIEKEICNMLREVLINASKKDPPAGVAHNAQSRALYAADIMLCHENEHKIQPKLLEINFTPDCKRACDYYPDFYNDIFKLLFLNNFNEDVFRKL